MRILFVHIVLAIMVSGCTLPDWLGTKDLDILPGERIAVLPSKSDLSADPTLSNVDVVLPAVAVNTIWFYSHYSQSYHLALTTPLSQKVEYEIGEAPEEAERISSAPIIANGRIFTLDGEGTITARLLENPNKILWTNHVRTKEIAEGFFGITLEETQDKFLGAHIAYGNGKIFSTTTSGDVFAFDSRRGDIIWQRSFKLPIKSAPVVENERLFFITVTNQFYAIDVNDGKTLWNHAGISETTGILGSPSPRVENNVVLVPYSSGELYALAANNGRTLWADSLAALRVKNTSLFSLNDIDATPVVYDGIVYAAGHEGILSATDLLTGQRIWQQPISSLSTPWVAGDFMFVLSTKDELICLYRPDGRIKWIRSLPSYEDPEDFEGKITWNGPVLAGNRVYLVNNIEEMLAFSPTTGDVVSRHEIDEDVYMSPVVAGRKMYILSNDANLTVYN